MIAIGPDNKKDALSEKSILLSVLLMQLICIAVEHVAYHQKLYPLKKSPSITV